MGSEHNFLPAFLCWCLYLFISVLNNLKSQIQGVLSRKEWSPASFSSLWFCHNHKNKSLKCSVCGVISTQPLSCTFYSIWVVKSENLANKTWKMNKWSVEICEQEALAEQGQLRAAAGSKWMLSLCSSVRNWVPELETSCSPTRTSGSWTDLSEYSDFGSFSLKNLLLK